MVSRVQKQMTRRFSISRWINKFFKSSKAALFTPHKGIMQAVTDENILFSHLRKDAKKTRKFIIEVTVTSLLWIDEKYGALWNMWYYFTCFSLILASSGFVTSSQYRQLRYGDESHSNTLGPIKTHHLTKCSRGERCSVKYIRSRFSFITWNGVWLPVSKGSYYEDVY